MARDARWWAWRLLTATVGLPERGRRPRVVSVSSESGSLTLMAEQTPAYSESKAALNAVTRVLAAPLRERGILVNSNTVDPGWTHTDMGGAEGRPVAELVPGILWAASVPDDGPPGGSFRDGRTMPW